MHNPQLCALASWMRLTSSNASLHIAAISLNGATRFHGLALSSRTSSGSVSSSSAQQADIFSKGRLAEFWHAGLHVPVGWACACAYQCVQHCRMQVKSCVPTQVRFVCAGRSQGMSSAASSLATVAKFFLVWLQSSPKTRKHASASSPASPLQASMASLQNMGSNAGPISNILVSARKDCLPLTSTTCNRAAS